VILVDTSVWIDYFNGIDSAQTDKLDTLLSSTTVIVGDLILAEVLQGFRTDRDYQKAKELLLALEPVSLCSISSAVESAENYRHLRKQGATVRKTIDCLIATYCIRNNLPLLYVDRDFDPFSKYLELQSA
jgi:predicted nucleic acid-binding protein